MFLHAHGDKPLTQEPTQDNHFYTLVRDQLVAVSASNLKAANQIGRLFLDKRIPPEMT